MWVPLKSQLQENYEEKSAQIVAVIFSLGSPGGSLNKIEEYDL